MKVAVVTPYHDVPFEWLAQCNASVKAQTHPATHILVADGKPIDQARKLDAQHIRLPVKHGDYGDTPRCIGSFSAAAQGFDAIAYLDADNWFLEDHIASLVKAHRKTGAAVCTSMRQLHDLDGTLIGYCLNSDGRDFCDTNCLFLTRGAYDVLPTWTLMDPKWHAIGDRVMWSAIKQRNVATENTGLFTSAYRTSFVRHYEALGVPIPAGLREGKWAIEEALQLWEDEGNPPMRFDLRLEKAQSLQTTSTAARSISSFTSM